MTKEEFLTLETGDSVRIDYDGIVADYRVEREPGEVLLIPDGIPPIRIPLESADKWCLDAISRRGRKKAARPTKKTDAVSEEK